MAKSGNIKRRTDGERRAYGEGYKAGLVQAKSICEREDDWGSASIIEKRIEAFDELNWPKAGMLTP